MVTFPFGEGGPLAVDEVSISLFMGADLICLLLFAARQKVTKNLVPFKGMARRPSLDNPNRLM